MGKFVFNYMFYEPVWDECTQHIIKNLLVLQAEVSKQPNGVMYLSPLCLSNPRHNILEI